MTIDTIIRELTSLRRDQERLEWLLSPEGMKWLHDILVDDISRFTRTEIDNAIYFHRNSLRFDAPEKQ